MSLNEEHDSRNVKSGPAFPQTMVLDGRGMMTSGWDGYGSGGMSTREHAALTLLARRAYVGADQFLNPPLLIQPVAERKL